MKHLLMVLFLCAGLLVVVTRSQSSAEEFEIHVGKTAYDVVPDRPFSIVTAKGERVEIVLRRKLLRFAEHGISFNYLPPIKVSSEKGSGVITITAESAYSPLILIQLYLTPIAPGAVRTTLLDSFRNEFKSQKAKFLKGSGGTVKRRFHGVEREGQVLKFVLGGQRMESEIFAFSKDKRTVAVILQHDLSEADLAKIQFSIIADSLQ